MRIQIKRYHLILFACGLVFLSSIGIFSLEQSTSLQEALPLQPVPSADLFPLGLNEPEPPAAASPARGQKRIALTFDDGPHPRFTERLLQVLGEQNVRATFFVVGKQVQRHPELLEKIFHSGHELANHTYHHPDLRTLSREEVSQELERTDRLVRSIVPAEMRFFRPPGGRYDDDVVREAQRSGYVMALWNILPQDHVNPPADAILERVLKDAKKDGVILLHSGIENTLAVLPAILSSLKQQDYEFVTLTELDTASKESLPYLVRLKRKR